MKKWTIMLFTVLFLFAAVGCAQEYYTIDQLREQAAEGWHNVYEAYGRKIIADIDITIPDVEQVPVEKLEFARRETQVTEKETGKTAGKDSRFSCGCQCGAGQSPGYQGCL